MGVYVYVKVYKFIVEDEGRGNVYRVHLMLVYHLDRVVFYVLTNVTTNC